MAQIVAWNGGVDIDYRLGVGVSPGDIFDPLASQITVSDPGLNASQFDAYQAGPDLAFVKVRDTLGAELSVDQRHYFYIPGMTLEQIGTLAGGGSNFALTNGSRYVIGDGTSGTSADALGNFHDLPADSSFGHYFLGLDGADSFFGGAGPDRILGNRGLDVLFGRGGNDSIYGGQDSDTLFGGNGDNLLHGDRGDDFLFGGNGDDHMFGGPGRDFFRVVDGKAWMYGGQGDDVFDLSSALHYKYVQGDLGADSLVAAGMNGRLLALMGLGNDTVRIHDHVGGLRVEFGGGDNLGEIDFGIRGGLVIGGADRDTWDLGFQPLALDGYGYGVYAGDGDDVARFVGQVDGNPFTGVYLGAGADVLDLSAFFGADFINYGLGDGDDTVHAGPGGIYDLGLGDNLLLGGFGRFETQLRYDWQSLGITEIEGFVPGRDKIGLAADAFTWTGQFIGYAGTGGTIGNSANFVVIDDKPYASLDQLLLSLPMGYRQQHVDAMFLFLNDNVELWYDPDIGDGESGRVLLEFPDYTSLGSLSSLGALSGTTPISFVISSAISLAPPDPSPPVLTMEMM